MTRPTGQDPHLRPKFEALPEPVRQGDPIINLRLIYKKFGGMCDDTPIPLPNKLRLVLEKNPVHSCKPGTDTDIEGQRCLGNIRGDYTFALGTCLKYLGLNV